MTKYIVWKTPSGIASFTEHRDELTISIDEHIQLCLNNGNHKGFVFLCVVDSVPSDRMFREAWEDDGKGIVVNMPKARSIHLDRLREKRKGILAKLDVEWGRAMAKNNKTLADTIEAKRQKLRDMPQAVESDLDAANTPDELKLIVPKELRE
jgi:hypothetical protein